MKFLVVDNGKHVTALGQMLRALGQEVILAPDPVQAIAVARHLAVDVAVLDVVLPVMNGVEFIETLWLFDRNILVAFRQCSHDQDLVAQAAEIGVLFPAQWTRADIERLVAELSRRKAQALAAGTQGMLVSSLRHGTEEPGDQGVGHGRQGDGVAARDALMLVPVGRIVRKLKVTCRSWEQVEKLCDQRDAGKDFLTLRGSHQLAPGDPLVVALHLPASLVVFIDAEVASVSQTSNESRYVIHLSGFTAEQSAGLRSMAMGVLASISRSARAAPAAALDSPGARARAPIHRPVDQVPEALVPETLRAVAVSGSAPAVRASQEHQARNDELPKP